MKRIVVCSDGTWQKPGQPDPSHVTSMARAVLPTAPDGITQAVFYDAGVGAEGGLRSWFVGGITGNGLTKNIQDCYRFLVHNYGDGDEIYLFGFSRGAYTVRSLAGLIRNCGVLAKSQASRITEAFDLYRSAEVAPSSGEAKRFRAKYSREASIWFIGVWDTVGALGIPLRGLRGWTMPKHRFHDTELSRYVRHGYHALAIDEKRAPFQPSLWQAKPKDGQTVEQVWFAGEHSDVGGTSSNPILANPPFDWMRERASRAGLALDAALEPANGILDAKGGVGALWNRIGSSQREIGGETQSVHPSAFERYADRAGGVPQNLKLYLDNPNPQIYGVG